MEKLYLCQKIWNITFHTEDSPTFSIYSPRDEFEQFTKIRCFEFPSRGKMSEYFISLYQYRFFSSSKWNGFFNWTMTFRQDSEFYTPYGKIRQTSELPTNLDEHITNFGEENKEAEYLKDKNMTIAWFVSNCGAR